jgi:hypothetical protein
MRVCPRVDMQACMLTRRHGGLEACRREDVQSYRRMFTCRHGGMEARLLHILQLRSREQLFWKVESAENSC